MLPERIRLRKSKEFQRVYLDGKAFYGKFITLRVLSRGDLDDTRFGFAPSRKIRRAVDRNLVKRRYREICRKCYPFLKSGYDVVVNIKESAVTATFAELRDDFYGLLKRAGLFLTS